MKQLLLIAIAFFLMLALFGCGSCGETNEMRRTNPVENEATNHITEDEQECEESTRKQEYEEPVQKTTGNPAEYSWSAHPWDLLTCASLEQLLESHSAIREGKAVGELSGITELLDFVALEKLCVPINIPKEYLLYEINVYKAVVCFTYLREEDMVSVDAITDACIKKRSFEFRFFYPENESSMEGMLAQEGATKKDLIDGKYLFREPNELLWVLDGNLICLNMPLPLLDKQPDKEKKLAEMIRYAEVEVVDLGG